MTGPPGGLGGGPWWGLTAATVVLAGLLFWLASTPLAATFDRWLEAPAEPAPAAGDELPVDDPGAAAPPVVAPGEASWTLVDVAEAVRVAGVDLGTLITEARSELPEFRALDSNDRTRSARARQRFEAWGQIWRNRVSRVAGRLPPAEACAVHAAMEPACHSLRGVLAQLESVAGADRLELATERLELAAGSLELFLDPPPPAGEEGGEGGGEGEDVEHDDTADQA